ncbi:MFS transporter [Sporomusa sp.]|uniref:MFS transporter n=1 Tax=Sporomusa sp. TaxID=2078658 RepID=UPI002D186BA9|nr:MFS transporter [Sporomusa sp.]HWR05737.1 MFS transporter [Sporomusa sp.]HWR42073.1 MFS transporter [Sporomusa sp.]
MSNSAVDSINTRLQSGYARHRLALILLITLLIAYIDRVNVAVLVVDNTFLTDMGIANDPVAKGSLMTVFLVCYGIGSVLLSPVGDWLGPRKATLISILFWTLALIWGGFATGLVTMLLSRALLGIGESMHYPMQSKFVKNWFPPHERGKANATWLIGLNIAPMVAMPLFAWMIAAVGWRDNFFFLASLGIIPLFLIWKYTADHPHLYQGISPCEQAYIEAALSKEQAVEGTAAPTNAWQSFLIVTRDYRVWLLVLAYSGTSSIYWGVITWLPSYLKEAREFSWAAMGAWASLPYIMAIVVKVGAGFAIDKIGRPALFLATGLLGSAIFIWLGAYAENNIIATILISCGVGTLAMGTPCAWVLLQQLLPGKVAGTGAGFMNGVASIISAASPLMVGFFIALTGSYIGGLMYMVGWGVFGAGLCLVLAWKR